MMISGQNRPRPINAGVAAGAALFFAAGCGGDAIESVRATSEPAASVAPGPQTPTEAPNENLSPIPAVDGVCAPGTHEACGDTDATRFCRSDSTWSDCRCGTLISAPDVLSCRRAGVVGRWRGRMTISVDRPSFEVELAIEGGAYSARCPAFGDSGPGICLNDGGGEVRIFELQTVADDGSISGRLEMPQQVEWSYVTDLWLSADEEKLTFQLWSPWNGDEIRPTRFELQRSRRN